MNFASRMGGAWNDLIGGFRRHPLWRFMADRELKLRYARSFLGPIWITLTMGFWVAGLTLLYGGLFGAPLREIAPFITLGVISWNFLAAVMNESCTCFLSAKGYLMQSRMPLPTFVWLVFYRNILVLLHNMAIYFLMVLIFQLWPNQNWLLAFIGWPVFFLAALGFAMLLSVLAARFRDITPLVSSIMTVGFFLTPVMWRPADLMKNHYIAAYNPLAHLITVFRDPLLGVAPSQYAILFALVTAIVLFLAGLVAIAASRKNIMFWL